MAPINLLHRLISCPFGPAVSAHRIRFVFFSIRRLLGPIENVIGRVMHQKCARPLCFFREYSRGHAIDLMTSLWLLLSLVDRRIRGGIDHHSRGAVMDPFADRASIGQIDFWIIDANQIPAAATTNTTTTYGSGTITEYSPGSTFIVKESSGPVTYNYGDRVEYARPGGRDPSVPPERCCRRSARAIRENSFR